MLHRYLLAVPAAAALLCAPAFADTVKIGIIAPMSGPYSQVGKAWAEAVKGYQKLNGNQVDGHTVEVIFRDLPEINPAQAKALAQELVIKEKVQYLGGLYFTPDAVAVAQVAQQAKLPVVIFNAATSSTLEKSPYLLRVSYTLPQISVPIARYALDKGVKKVVTIISDYAPGADSEAAFSQAFKAGGGAITGSIHVPLKTSDFGPFMQTAKSLKPDAIFVFMPGGPPTFALIKSYTENGLKAAGVRFLGSAETGENDLQTIGAPALGLETGHFYSPVHPSAKNQQFTATLQGMFPKSVVSAPSVEAYDGMYVIGKMIAATAGKADGDKALAAAKGLAWESPRGPVRIDPASRELVQNVYIRVVEREPGGLLVNREIKTYENQPDYGRKGVAAAGK